MPRLGRVKNLLSHTNQGKGGTWCFLVVFRPGFHYCFETKFNNEANVMNNKPCDVY